MARRNKFHNIRTVVNGITFHSRKEATRYVELVALDAEGAISDLRLQVSHTLSVNGVKICRYVSDFEYERDGQHVIEDVKSERTIKEPLYRLKKKLMAACLGLTIEEYL